MRRNARMEGNLVSGMAQMKRRYSVSGLLIVCGVLLTLGMSPAQATIGYSGSTNWEWGYISSIGQIQVVRSSSLFYDPYGPTTGYLVNDFMWHGSFQSVNGWGIKLIPSVLNMRLYIKDTTWAGGADYWSAYDFRPVSTTQYGITITYSFTYGASYQGVSGSLTETYQGTAVNTIIPDTKAGSRGSDGYRYLGGLSIDMAEQYGWTQVDFEGKFSFGIKNADGALVKNNNFNLKTVWDVSWRLCGFGWPWQPPCTGSENGASVTIIQGDYYGGGDGWMYLRAGTTKES